MHLTGRQLYNQLCLPLLSPQVVSGKGVLVFLLRSDSPAALHVISGSSHIAMDVAEGRPDSWTLRRHAAAASGRRFPASRLEESKSWTPRRHFSNAEIAEEEKPRPAVLKRAERDRQ